MKKQPKRLRKPQQPGLTAKGDERHFVKHEYHDHSQIKNDCNTDYKTTAKIPKCNSFPMKLHTMLDQIERDGLSEVISWLSHGRAFIIKKPKSFVKYIMPSYSRQTKLTSFQRQLNLYGFLKITRGKDAGSYYHECFLRGMPFLARRITRTRIKGTGFKAASSPDKEPNFYSMTVVGNRISEDTGIQMIFCDKMNLSCAMKTGESKEKILSFPENKMHRHQKQLPLNHVSFDNPGNFSKTEFMHDSVSATNVLCPDQKDLFKPREVQDQLTIQSEESLDISSKSSHICDEYRVNPEGTAAQPSHLSLSSENDQGQDTCQDELLKFVQHFIRDERGSKCNYSIFKEEKETSRNLLRTQFDTRGLNKDDDSLGRLVDHLFKTL